VNTFMKIVFVVLLASTAALAGIWIARSHRPQPLELEHATLFPVPRAIPGFSLVDQAGQPFGPERLKGHWSMMFFGYTQCPDLCPTTLATLAAARRELADLPDSESPQPVFISIDPARDTPDKLAGYVKFFDPALTGVTGEAGAIEALTRQLGVAVVVGKPDASGNYTISHSATLFLVDPQGRLAGIFSAPHTPDGIAHDYRLVMQHLGQARR
jgi:protein SCO1/2